MKTNKENLVELENSTLNYFGSIRLISTLLATSGFGSSANAQVQYTDVNPDYIFNYNLSSFYLLDLNNDGIPDFKLGKKIETWNCYSGGYSGGTYGGGMTGLVLENLGALTGNRSKLDLLNSCPPYMQQVKPMQVGTILRASPSSWSSYNPNIPWKVMFGSGGCGSTCYLYNYAALSVDFYVGLRIGVPGSYHLGWMRFITVGGVVIIKDYAVETTPNRPIIIGATFGSVGLNDIEGTSKINLNGKNLTVQFFNESAKYHIQIASLTGQVIESNDNVNMFWNFSFNHPGVYMVTISNENGKFTKKLFVI